MPRSMEEIANALMGALYAAVGRAAGDVTADASDDPFICWFKPGVPFEADDLRFAKFMLKGQGASEDERAADASLQMTQAAGFSRFIDFVPSVNGIHDGRVEGGVLRPGSATLSEAYKRILESSQVAEFPDPPGLAEQIAKLRERAKPMEEAYFKCQEEHQAAKSEYSFARLKATFSPKDDMEFRAKGAMLKGKVTRTLQVWEVDGFKTQYEGLLAEIQSMASKRKPAIWRMEALNQFNSLPEGMDATFGEARFTLPYPGGFATSNSGWTTFDFETKAVEAMSSSKSTKWSASAGVGWGSFKIGGSASGSTLETQSVTKSDGFSLKMSIAQIPLLRNWFDPWFLRSEFWRFNPGSIEGKSGDVVANGASPPAGLLVAYPVAAIFAKDITIGLEELKDESSELVKTLTAEGKSGWGLGAINLGGSYERNSQEKKQKTEVANGKVTVEGLQLIGVVCETMSDGRLPNPKDGLKWVGET